MGTRMHGCHAFFEATRKRTTSRTVPPRRLPRPRSRTRRPGGRLQRWLPASFHPHAASGGGCAPRTRRGAPSSAEPRNQPAGLRSAGLGAHGGAGGEGIANHLHRVACSAKPRRRTWSAGPDHLLAPGGDARGRAASSRGRGRESPQARSQRAASASAQARCGSGRPGCGRGCAKVRPPHRALGGSRRSAWSSTWAFCPVRREARCGR